MADGLIPDIKRSLVYAKGTDAALRFAEEHPEQFSTRGLVEAVIDATWDDIKEA